MSEINQNLLHNNLVSDNLNTTLTADNISESLNANL
jgi:hypothetical protein